MKPKTDFRSLIERKLRDLETTIGFVQHWNSELKEQGKAAEINTLKLHYLDGQREILEEILTLEILWRE